MGRCVRFQPGCVPEPDPQTQIPCKPCSAAQEPLLTAGTLDHVGLDSCLALVKLLLCICKSARACMNLEWQTLQTAITQQPNTYSLQELTVALAIPTPSKLQSRAGNVGFNPTPAPVRRPYLPISADGTLFSTCKSLKSSLGYLELQAIAKVWRTANKRPVVRLWAAVGPRCAV